MKNKNSGGLLAITIILAAITLVMGILYFTTKGDTAESPLAPAAEPESKVFTLEGSEFTSAVSVKGSNEEIFLPLDGKKLYYTLTLENKAAFYEWNGSDFTPFGGKVNTVSTKIKASYQTLPVTVSWVKSGDKTYGCGVFTAEMDKTEDIYDFAFVKLIDKPKAYGTGYLLLADFNKADFYKADKTYSEIYSFDMSSKSVTTYVSNNTRLIDKNGTFRQDWTILCDSSLTELENEKYFISSRYYTSEETGKRSDIMLLSNAYRPAIVAKDIIGTRFKSDKDGLHYLKKTDSGFAHMVLKDKKEKAKYSFTGDYFEDYFAYGDFILDKISLEMTNVFTNEKVTLTGIDASESDGIAVSGDGKKIAVYSFGKENANGLPVQSIILMNLDPNESNVLCFSEPLLFNESSEFYFADENTLCFARALETSGSKVGTVSFVF